MKGRRDPIFAGALAFAALALANGLHATPFNNYVLLADAFAHGHAWINWPGAYIDALEWHGRRYVIEAPMPALLLLPFVAVFGTSVNQTLAAMLLAAVAAGTGFACARRLGVPRAACWWLTGFLLLGTDLFWAATFGDVWFLAHVAALAFTMLALCELLGKRRAWLVALFAGCAVLSRFSLIGALPVYAALLGWEASAAQRRARLLAFAGALLPFTLFWIAYNQARWGVPYDIGYAEWYHRDSAGMPTGSPFRLAYLPEQLYSFFVRFPDVRGQPPYLVPTILGVALTWTSPALALAVLARTPRLLVLAMWSATALVALPNLIYYVNGYAQFGMRHALDFEPFLFVLMALAVRGGISRAGMALVAWSMLAGAWGVWYWRTVYRP